MQATLNQATEATQTAGALAAGSPCPKCGGEMGTVYETFGAFLECDNRDCLYCVKAPAFDASAFGGAALTAERKAA